MTNLVFQCRVAYSRSDSHVVKEFLFFFPPTLFREWMGKVDRARSRPSDGQEGWKESSEDHAANKTSRADSTDPRAPSPASMGQYKSAQQDHQVPGNVLYLNLKHQRAS